MPRAEDTQTKYWWGDQLQSGMANCKDCTDTAAADQPVKVGNFKPNPFGLYDMGGGVDQWVEDCWHRNYQGAPADGSAWVGGDCASHVIRSGSWKNDARYVGRPIATITIPTFDIRPMDSGSLYRLSAVKEGFHEDVRLDAAVALSLRVRAGALGQGRRPRTPSCILSGRMTAPSSRVRSGAGSACATWA